MDNLNCLSVQSLSLNSPNGFVVDDVTITINAGEIVTLLGSNGAGKSTLLNLMAGVLSPSSGEVSLNTKNIHQNPANRKHLGYLPDRPPLYDELTIREQLAFACDLFCVPKSLRTNHIHDVLDSCELNDKANTLISRLSKGYRQRCGLAQTLVHQPNYLLLDEPTEGLDPLQILNLRKQLKSLSTGGTGILMSTHLMQEVRALADRVLIMHKGKLVRELDASEFVTDGALEKHFTDVLFDENTA